MLEHFEWGETVRRESVDDEKITSLWDAAEARGFVTPIEFRKDDSRFGLVLDFEVERPQVPKVDMHYVERILVSFHSDPRHQPLVLALRRQFPDTPHQNLRQAGNPQSLCLFDEPYAEISPYITQSQFLDRIGSWLKRASTDELHQSDQPLEPLFVTDAKVVIDRNLLSREGSTSDVIDIVIMSQDPLILYAADKPDLLRQGNENSSIFAIHLKAPPSDGRTIQHRPDNLELLKELMTKLELNLQEILVGIIKSVTADAELSSLRNSRPLVILELPKVSHEGEQPRDTEWWAFLILADLAKLAEIYGLAGTIDGYMGVLVGDTKVGDTSAVLVGSLQTLFAMSPKEARAISGVPESDPTFTLIGVGSLGSQVVFNLAKQGFANWTVIDNDCLYPHNFTRYALSATHLGERKTDAIQYETQAALNFHRNVESVPADFLDPDKGVRERIAEALHKSDLTIDLSTSRAISRSLSHEHECPPCVSSFITPDAHSLVVLKEDSHRALVLTDLEQQLAALQVSSTDLQGLFQNSMGEYSYAGACRQVATILPNDNIMIFAGILSKYIKSHYGSDEAEILIWQLDQESGNLTRTVLTPSPIHKTQVDGWELRTSDRALEQMRSHRSQKLPNETGGVLLGSLDFDARTANISSIIPSPLDSEEWPTSYRRGIQGLSSQITAIKGYTANELSYIGEWHSHPDGASLEPSGADREALQWLTNELASEGLPAIMLIIGQGDFNVLLSVE